MTDKNNETTKTSEEFAFEEMAELVREKEVMGVEFQVFIRTLEEHALKANRRLEVARMIANISKTTKTRKPRSDRGKKRKPRVQAVAGQERTTVDNNE